jgi:hypothetical protein
MYGKRTIVLVQGSIPNIVDSQHPPLPNTPRTDSCASTTYDGSARKWLEASTARALRNVITIDSNVNCLAKIAKLGRHGTV